MPSPSFSWRKLFLTLHLWLGLACGAFVVILCLSGTLLALQGPVEAWVNRDLLRVAPMGAPQALETLVPHVQAETGKSFTAVVIMPQETDAWQFLQGRQITYVNPYTGAVLGGFNPAVAEAFRWIFRLHRWLLLETPVGRPITGAATLVFLFVLLSGFVLWWPKRLGALARVLTLRRGTAWKGRNYDLHVVLGFYALIPLLVMGASGLYWSYNPAFKQVVYAALDGKTPPAAETPRAPEKPEAPRVTALPYSQILAHVRNAYPYQGPLRLTFPAQGDRAVELAKTHAPSPFSVPYVDRLYLDSTSGEIVRTEPFAAKSRAEKLLSLIKHIHLGTVFGGLSLTLYVLACLIGTSLPITGMIHWLGKRSSKRRKTPAPAAVFVGGRA